MSAFLLDNITPTLDPHELAGRPHPTHSPLGGLLQQLVRGKAGKIQDPSMLLPVLAEPGPRESLDTARRWVEEVAMALRQVACPMHFLSPFNPCKLMYWHRRQ